MHTRKQTPVHTPPRINKVKIRLIIPMSGAKSWIEVYTQGDTFDTLQGDDAIHVLAQLSRLELITLIEGYPITLQGDYINGALLRPSME